MNYLRNGCVSDILGWMMKKIDKLEKLASDILK